ncbi:MAG: hypothetical protein EON93_07415 [Burkholderiales bacterium]|nr:MAG: hypothetical protein EON93_07415 [Burkholderiales bacterium]
MLIRTGVAALLASCLCISSCMMLEAEDEDSSASFDFLLHSDLPLWLDWKDEALWPRNFTTETSFGCMSQVAFGDWKLTYTDNGQGYVSDPVWWTVTNYGVIHCGAVFSSSYERGGSREHHPGFFVNLGIDMDSGLELWVWQIGLRPGSDYLLLARPKDSDRDQFLVLDPDCSAGEMRETDHMLSSWRTDYCNVPNQSVMRAIARGAAAKPALGTLDLVGDAATPDR